MPSRTKDPYMSCNVKNGTQTWDTTLAMSTFSGILPLLSARNVQKHLNYSAFRLPIDRLASEKQYPIFSLLIGTLISCLNTISRNQACLSIDDKIQQKGANYESVPCETGVASEGRYKGQ